MRITVRPAKATDASQMLKVYKSFTEKFVGLALRTRRSFTRMLRKKDNVNLVAFDLEKRMIGYLHARVDRRINRGEFGDIVVDPECDFTQVAEVMVKKANTLFMKKKVSSIIAGSLRNPAYEKLFLREGFFESESTGVFMYAILDVQKFLHELRPVMDSRLELIKAWNGLIQLECDGHSLFLEKTSEGIQQVAWTNQPVDLEIKLSADTLTKLVFGMADPVNCHRDGLLKTQSKIGKDEINNLLGILFPRKQFLIMDYW